MSAKQHTNQDNLMVLHQDNHLIVVNKRPGDLIQGDKTKDKPLVEIVKDYIALKYNKPGAVFLGVVHRLDRPTSGVVVFARTSKALARLNQQFAQRATQKTYWAVVKAAPEALQGSLVHYLVRRPNQNKSFAYTKEVPDSKKAVLHYRTVAQSEHYTLLEIDLETGRHHQIRAQLTAIGCPIKGDLKYGFDRSNPDGSIHLHARKLMVTHPVTKESLIITAPTPDETLWRALVSNL
ncbi:MAG: RluA family pseudouridine synthase [Flavobacteriaceae bacterium]|nr:RluA family pseudouridine synthase [Flavobacteriaceae bacterium]MDG1961729.1 RluA family pseudouridine synthase [Flavobacteriaceae bacterium]